MRKSNSVEILSASISDAKGHFARLDKKQEVHDKATVCDFLG